MNRFIFSAKSLFVALVALAGVTALGAANATTITFSEFAVGTLISNQYAALGVTFGAGTNGNLPIIANDGAMGDSPVLSPNPVYAGDFWINFLTCTTHVDFNSGFWDTIGTAAITVYDNLGGSTVYTNVGTGAEVFAFNAVAGTYFTKIHFDSSADPAGGDIGTFTFNVPEPGTLLLLGVGLLAAGFGRRASGRK